MNLQFDYYRINNTNTSNNAKAVKKYNNTATIWWLRTAHKIVDSAFLDIQASESSGDAFANNEYGVSPAFRLA